MELFGSWFEAFSLSFVAVSLSLFPSTRSVFSAFFPVVELSGFSLFATFFFHFIRLFWNQVFTCASFKPRMCDSFARFVESKYLCSEKVFSRTLSCRSVKTVRDFRHRFPLGVRRVGFTRKYTGRGWWIAMSELGGGSEKRQRKSSEIFQKEETMFLLLRLQTTRTIQHKLVQATQTDWSGPGKKLVMTR